MGSKRKDFILLAILGLWDLPGCSNCDRLIDYPLTAGKFSNIKQNWFFLEIAFFTFNNRPKS